MPRDILDKLDSRMHGFNYNSADAFSYSIFNGLTENLNDEFKCINIAPLGAFPRYNGSPYFNNHKYIDKGVEVNCIPFSTVIGYMYYSIYRNLKLALRKEIEPDKRNVILLYSINIPALKAIQDIRHTFNGLFKTVLIIPDFLEDCMTKSIGTTIKKSIFGEINQYYKEIDAFVFLTEQMKDRIDRKAPYCIIEGIYSKMEVPDKTSYSNKKIILYSGMLYEKFGVKNLIDAFLGVADKNVVLQICGCGELEDYIKEKAIIDSRIEYKGLVKRKEVLQLQSRASLLVNPRQPNNEYTKYSFPSKNIEYLASGTPVLIYELEGIPQEYYNYCFHLSSNHLDMDSLRDEIERIFSMDADKLENIAKKAYKFISENKNSKVQVRKILNLIKSI